MMSKKWVGSLVAGVLALSAGSLMASAAPAMTDSSFWSWHNLYVLGQVGWEKAQLDSTAGPVTSVFAGTVMQSHTDDTGVAGRLALGYSLLPKYLDLQLGYTKYQGGYQNITVDSGAATLVAKNRTQMETVDLVLEGKLPLNQFYVLAKAGGAYVHFTQSVDDNGAEVGSVVLADTYHESSNTVRPLLGAGLGYHVNDHVFVEAGYQYLFGKGNTVTSNSNPVPNTQFASLGVGYYF